SEALTVARGFDGDARAAGLDLLEMEHDAAAPRGGFPRLDLPAVVPMSVAFDAELELEEDVRGDPRHHVRRLRHPAGQVAVADLGIPAAPRDQEGEQQDRSPDHRQACKAGSSSTLTQPGWRRSKAL